MAWDFNTRETCDRPRFGWYCRLPYGHDGPCPAWPHWWAHPVWWYRTKTF